MFRRQSKTNFLHVYYEGIKPLRGKSPEELLNETLHEDWLSPETWEVNEVIICHSQSLLMKLESVGSVGISL